MGKIIVRAQEKNESIKGYVTALSQEKDTCWWATAGKDYLGQKLPMLWLNLAVLDLYYFFYFIDGSFDANQSVATVWSAFWCLSFILLNLALSTLAAVQAPLIMMSQNRAAEYDRLQALNDFNVNKKSEEEIRFLHAKLIILFSKTKVTVRNTKTTDRNAGSY